MVSVVQQDTGSPGHISQPFFKELWPKTFISSQILSFSGSNLREISLGRWNKASMQLKDEDGNDKLYEQLSRIPSGASFQDTPETSK